MRDGLVAFLSRRKLSDGTFLVWCRYCGCEVRATQKVAEDEWNGEHVACKSCCPGAIRPGPRSPQESKDISYHGSRFHGGEW